MIRGTSTTDRSSLWGLIEFAAFVLIVALFAFVGPKAGMRGMGVAMLVVAAAQLITRRIPYGWEGREPSGYLSGTAAVVVGVLAGILALAMLFKTEFMLEMLGWGAH